MPSHNQLVSSISRIIAGLYKSLLKFSTQLRAHMVTNVSKAVVTGSPGTTPEVNYTPGLLTHHISCSCKSLMGFPTEKIDFGGVDVAQSVHRI